MRRDAYKSPFVSICDARSFAFVSSNCVFQQSSPLHSPLAFRVRYNPPLIIVTRLTELHLRVLLLVGWEGGFLAHKFQRATPQTIRFSRIVVGAVFALIIRKNTPLRLGLALFYVNLFFSGRPTGRISRRENKRPLQVLLFHVVGVFD